MNNKQKKDSWILGHVHSLESLGALDGPGLRSVVFFQGCPLHCQFCHNIDCAQSEGGTPYTDLDLVDELMKFKPYWGKKKGQGGVTFSGGEPLQQYVFTYSVAKALHDQGVHIAVDTCLYTTPECLDVLLPVVDLWMISIKELDTEKHKKLTGRDNKKILDNLRYLDDHLGETAKIRIRILILPTMTDGQEYLENLAKLILTVNHLEVVELLAYNSHARFKWEELHHSYELDGIPDATVQDLQKAGEVLRGKGLEVVW